MGDNAARNRLDKIGLCWSMPGGDIVSGIYMANQLGNPDRARLDLRPFRLQYAPAQDLLDKLLPSNNRNLGSTSSPGNRVPTGIGTRMILDVVNTWLIRKLTYDELREIFFHRELFTFSIGVGDRRDVAEVYTRFRIADNWHGEDVVNRVLTPDPFNDPPYHFTLTFSSEDGTMKITDTHSTPNTYGSIRYFTIRKK